MKKDISNVPVRYRDWQHREREKGRNINRERHKRPIEIIWPKPFEIITLIIIMLFAIGISMNAGGK